MARKATEGSGTSSYATGGGGVTLEQTFGGVLLTSLLLGVPALGLGEGETGASVRDIILEWRANHVGGKPFTQKGSKQKNLNLFRKLVRHEHVVTRSSLRQALLDAAAGEVDSLLRGTITCLVTVSESKRLDNAAGAGWERYNSVEIIVWDPRSGAFMLRSSIERSA